MKILVDTNVIIDYLRLKNKQETAFYKVFKNKKNIAALSFVTIIELSAGKNAVRGPQRDFIDEIIAESEVLEGNMPIYTKAADIIRDNVMNFQDAIIAAQAVIYDLPIMTSDVLFFRHVYGLHAYLPDYIVERFGRSLDELK